MNKKLDTLIHIITFINVLFIGSDIFSFEFIGVTIRYVQISLIIGFLLLIYKRKDKIFISKILFIYLFIMLITSLLAINIKVGIIYYLSILYNFIFVFLYFKEYIKEYKIKEFTNIFRYTCYIISFLMVVISILQKFGIEILNYGYYLDVYRINLWFFEPSYLSTYISIWYSLSLYYLIINRNKSYLLDLILSIITFILATATTGFISIIVGLILVLFLSIQHLNLKHYIYIISISFVCALLTVIFFPKIIDVFFLRIFNGIVSASGDRIIRYKETFEVFLKYPLFGIGTGCYGVYFNKVGLVPTNVFLEMLACLGIVGTIVFMLFMFYPLIKLYKSDNNDLRAYNFSLIVFFIILQANQNYLRLYMFMIIGVIYGIYEKGNDIYGKHNNSSLQLF